MSVEDLRRAAAELAATAGLSGQPVAEPEPVVSPASARHTIEAIQRELLEQPWLRELYPGLEVSGVIDTATRAAMEEFTARAAQAVDVGAAAVSQVLPSLPSPVGLPVARSRRQLGNTGKALIALVGGMITILTMVTGLGFLSENARDIAAVAVAALTPVLIFYSGRDRDADPPA